MNKNKFIDICLIIKTVIALIMTFGLITKANPCVVAENLGNFIVGGNLIVGAITLSALSVIYFIFMHIFYIDTISFVKKRILIMTCFDIILGGINIIVAYPIFLYKLNMGIPMAINEVLIKGGGENVVIGLLSLTIFSIIYLNKNYREQNEQIVEVKNSLFALYGRIGRLSYLGVMVLICICTVFLSILFPFEKLMNLGYWFIAFFFYTIFVSVIDMFASSKRVRDIKWNQLYLVLLILPVIGFFARLPLLFVKGKE